MNHRSRLLLGFVGALCACGQAQPQSASCAAYVACVQALDEARGTSTDLARFLEGGPCWGSPPGAELCDQACTNGLSWMQERWTDLPEACAP